MEKVIKTTANVLIAACVCIAAVLFVMYPLGIRPYIVMSGSMEPEIHTGSVCLVNTKVPYTDIEEGDIVTFDHGMEIPVTHRVLRITEDGMETKGDANDTSDGITTREDNYIGKTFFSIPYAGYAFHFLHTKRGKILMGTFAVILIILTNICCSLDEE